VSFDIKQLEPAKQEKSVQSTVHEALIGPPNLKVDVSGRITFQGPDETVFSKEKR
jgi:hypothetical protein